MKRLGISLAGASLFAAAAAWTLQQQAGYVIASWRCVYDQLPIWTLTAIAAVLLLLGIWASATALAQSGEEGDFWRPRHFLSTVALMAAPLFLFAILLQAAAALYLPGCAG